jgi:hypothetical protein
MEPYPMVGGAQIIQQCFAFLRKASNAPGKYHIVIYAPYAQLQWKQVFQTMASKGILNLYIPKNCSWQHHCHSIWKQPLDAIYH